MLGRHGDAFFAKQMRERILANSPNGMAGTIAFPDRELAGTGKVTRVAGQYEMPGPQNVVMGNSMLPGMAGDEMMPGMGQAEMLPGMGQIRLTDPRVLTAAAIGGVILFLMMGRRKAAPKRRSRRRRGRRRDALGRFA